MINKWVIAAACCGINLLILGSSRLAPLLFVACLDRFNADRGRTSFAFILCYLLRTLAGPLIGYSGAKFGLRSVTVFGCLMCSLGIGACFFAEDILAITIIYGVVYGLGFGFGTSLVPSILCLHFQENLTVANGMAYVGASIGGSILPSIVDTILPIYGVSGTFLILGAIVLNSVPCAMLLVMPDSVKQAISERRDGQNTNSFRKHKQDNENSSSQPYTIPNNNSTEPSCNNNSNSEGYVNKSFETNKDDTFSTNMKTVGFVTAVRRPSSVFEVTSGTPVLLLFNNGNTTSINKDTNLSVKAIRRPSSVFEITSGTPVLMQYDSSKRKSILYMAEDIINPPSESSQNSAVSVLGSLHIFSDPAFLVIAFIQSAFTFYLSVNWTIFIDYVRDKGIEQSREIIFLVCAPLSDAISRLLMGFVVDAGFMNETNFCAVCFLLLSLTCCLMAWFCSFGLMLFATLANAFISGATFITFPGMIFNFMNDEDRTMAMASRLIMYAPMGLAVSPAINFFRETLGSYDGIFYILGALNVLCCLMTYFIPHLVRRRENKALNGTTLKLNQNA